MCFITAFPLPSTYCPNQFILHVHLILYILSAKWKYS